MKKFIKVAISLSLVFALFLTTSAFGFSAGAAWINESQLQFNADGTFRILQFADCQDDYFPRRAMMIMMEKALDEFKPDLVVFTGDNVGTPSFELEAKLGIETILNPIAKRGIPFTFVFGNHDAEKVSKEYQMAVYQSYKECLAFDADPEIYGMGNHNLTIRSSNGTKDAFNLWMIDSNMYDTVNDGYDFVHEDQLNWYRETSKALESKNGGLVPSLVFQHICVPETFELLEKADATTPEGTEKKLYNGVEYILKLNPNMATGILKEFPCPSKTNAGELAAFVERKDVLGIVTGHDHVNSFIGTYQGIDLIQSPGITFQSYGDENRGARVIDLNENDPWNYETKVYSTEHFFGSDLKGKAMYTFYGSELGTIICAFIDTFKYISKLFK